jgi:hypothetical protein
VDVVPKSLSVSFNNEDIVFDPFDLVEAVHAFQAGCLRDTKMYEVAVDSLEAAIRLDRINRPEDIFRANGKDHSLCVMLA